MEWLWIIQLGINVIVVVSLVVWWKERHGDSAIDTRRSGSLQVFESQAQQLERDVLSYKKKTEDQLRFLIQVCEQAHAILMRHKNDSAASPSSLEEEELKALRSHSTTGASARSIPSVQELEAKKKAVRAEIPLDLRSLLRDQLT